VSSSHAKVSVDFTYADESDPGPYPFGPDTPIESGSDAHAIMIDRDACTLYELYDAHYSSSGSTAGSGAMWSLRSNALRPDGWTSADAAGLPIFAGLVRLDEVKAGVVDHAIRFTAARTDRSYVWPARHQAGEANDHNLPPMGARFRLRASFNISGFRADTRAILTAMKRYGLILADNGSDWYFTGTAENGWSEAMLDELKSVPASQFDAVDASSLMVSASSGRFRVQAHAPAPAPTGTKPSPKSSPKSSPKPSGTPAAPSPSPSPSASAAPAPLAAPVAPARFPWWLAGFFSAGVAGGFGLWTLRRRQRRRA
jgi:hypothetical protein